MLIDAADVLSSSASAILWRISATANRKQFPSTFNRDALAPGDPALTVDDIIRREGLGKGVVSRALPLAFLAPDIAGAILEGRQPEGLGAGALRRLTDLPREWDAQRRMFGLPTGR